MLVTNFVIIRSRAILKVLKESRGSKVPTRHMAPRALSNRVTLEIKAGVIRQRMDSTRGGQPTVNEPR